MSGYSYPPSMRQLVNELSKLPSVGEKSAVRLAYHLLTTEEQEARELSRAIIQAREKIRLCEQCFSLTESPLCVVCRDPNRKRSVICVVEKPADVIAFERSGSYHGLFHVLHGLWAPLRGVPPEETRIGELLTRVRKSFTVEDPLNPPVEEVILATGTTVEGDATALYVANSLTDIDLSLTRISQGLPKGGEIEYADETTLSYAIDGRQQV